MFRLERQKINEAERKLHNKIRRPRGARNVAETPPANAPAKDRPTKANKNLIGNQIIRIPRNSFKTNKGGPL